MLDVAGDVAAPAIRALVHHRLAFGGLDSDRAGFCQLRRLETVNLTDRDLRRRVAAKEREQVLGELPFVVQAR